MDPTRTDAFGPNKTLVFLHIPKTAGSTFRRILLRQQDFAVHAVNDGQKELKRELAADPAYVQNLARDYDAIIGHLVFDEAAFDPLAGNVIFASLMREPISRALSAYKQGRRRTVSTVHEQLKTMPAADVFEKFPQVRNRVTNNHLRALCRAQSLEAFDALARRHRFILGRQDRFEDFLRYLEATFSITLPRIEAANVAPRTIPSQRSLTTWSRSSGRRTRRTSPSSNGSIRSGTARRRRPPTRAALPRRQRRKRGGAAAPPLVRPITG